MKRNLSPTALVIFGITGNLSQRKLLPALYELKKQDRLPDEFSVIAIFHGVPDMESVMQQTELQLLRDQKECDPEILALLRKHFRPIQMDSTKLADYKLLKSELAAVAVAAKTTFNHLFYLAIPPDIFMPVIDNLAATGLNKSSENSVSRILIEKPFGNDLPSAKTLIEHLSSRFAEDQVFRIDHYLAKEMAQNILAFRFDNPLVEGVWSREFIDHIQISMLEQIDIQGRVRFYENMGALRDIIQNHLLQLMSLIMMEYPEGMSMHSIHREKLLLLQSIERIAPNHVDEIAIRGQYSEYAEEVENPKTTNETFAAIKFEVANNRWGGVPILVRTGKSMAQTATEITVVFKDRLHRDKKANLLILRIQPNEGISLKLLAKQPGFGHSLQPVNMNFDYHDAFTGVQPDPYQRVLVDAMRGDQALFASSQEVIASWELVEPVLEAWQSSTAKPEIYPKHSWGPAAASKLAASFGSTWYNPIPSPAPEPSRSEPQT